MRTDGDVADESSAEQQSDNSVKINTERTAEPVCDSNAPLNGQEVENTSERVKICREGDVGVSSVSNTVKRNIAE